MSGIELVLAFLAGVVLGIALDRSLRAVGIGGPPPDELIRVTRSLTGSYYFIPSAERLATFEGEELPDS
jgi:hypothetical protein